jgi:glutaredoxin 3
MELITIYTAALCPYCSMAKALLTKKGVAFTEVDVTYEPGVRASMQAKAGRTSVPQIWIGERHVGGCDDLYALDRSGELELLIADLHSDAAPG